METGVVSAGFTLEDDDDTRAMWNKQFSLEYTVSLGDNFLETELSITNTGKNKKNMVYSTKVTMFFFFKHSCAEF